MKLSELLCGIEYSYSGEDKEITHLTCDSRAAAAGVAFVAVSGGRVDGHSFAPKALESGAEAVICERSLGLHNEVIVDNSRAAYAIMSANFYGNPQRALKLIGVTGTNGKTTITYLLRDILKFAGKRVGLIGTIQSEIGDMVIPARHTTPDPMQLYSLFERMKSAGLEYVVMEVSSHALEQYRVHGLHFECALFTNLTKDHLDYHLTMENYYSAKKKLFSACGCAIINYDDEYGRRLYGEIDCKKARVSIEDDSADYTAHSVTFSSSGSRFIVVRGSSLYRVKIALPGLYSVSNAMCALGCAAELGIPFEEIVSGLSECKGVLGRTELIPTDFPFTIIRDYAHDPDGIVKILETVKSFAEGRVVTLFGCPGERDRTKRAPMGFAAAEKSDFVVLTSDNPRSEDEQVILSDTVPGIEEAKKPYRVIADRYEAIAFAMGQCHEGDVLLLLGKGHEDYQVLKYSTVYFDERYIVAEIARKLREQDNV